MDPTISFFGDTYRSIGFGIRRFTSKVCPAFATQELPREEAARINRRRKAASSAPSTSGNQPEGRRARVFKADTYKWHAMGHMPDAIRAIGTYENCGCDHVSWFKVSISYEPRLIILHQGEAEHKRCKCFFDRTSKNNAATQIAQLETRARYIHNTSDQFSDAKTDNQGGADEEYADIPPDVHHQVPASRRRWIDLRVWLEKNADDPAVKVRFVMAAVFQSSPNTHTGIYIHRTFIHALRTISSVATKISSLQIANLRFREPNTNRFGFLMTVYTPTFG